MPAVRRIAKLRRQIGADPHPFTPIKRNPRARHRVHAIIRKIYAAEAELVSALGQVNCDLDRRLRR